MVAFDRLFRITTFFACLSPDGDPSSIWFQAEDLAMMAARRPGRTTVRAHLSDGLLVDMRRPFQDALLDAISLS